MRFALAACVLLLTGLLALTSAPGLTPLRPTVAVAAKPTPCHPNLGNNFCQTPAPTNSATPCDNFSCTSPTPDTIVISPVPPDRPSPVTTPAYLIGLPPSPSAGATDVGGAIAPLGGGTTTDQPSPGGGGGGSETVKSGGPPVPFLLAMLVAASIGAGFLIWRFGPRGKKLPSVRAAPPILFTPYGSESRSTANLLDPSVNRPPD